MKHTIYPHRLNAYFAIPTGLWAIICCYFCGQLLDSGNRPLAIGYLVFAGISLLLGKYLLDTAKYHVEFTDQGITVHQGENSPVFLSWNDLSCLCRSTSPKGHPCLILSAEPLDAARAKGLAKKSAWTSKLYVENAVVLFLQQQKNPEALEAFLAEHFPITKDIL